MTKYFLLVALTIMYLSSIASPVRSAFAYRGTEYVSSADQPPYSAIDYVQDGLIAHWDAIENVGYGLHDSSSTVWIDLVGYRHATLAPFAYFSDNALCCDVRDPDTEKGAMAQSAANTYIPEPTEDVTITIEICFIRDVLYTLKFGEGMTIFSVGNAIPGVYGQNRWGIIGSGNNRMERLSHSGNIGGNRDIPNYFNSDDGRKLTCHTKMYNASYSGGGQYSNTTYWLNATKKTYKGTDGSRLRARSSGVSFGGNGSTEGICGKICFVRIYNRALSEEEIAHNYEVDKSRFNLP